MEIHNKGFTELQQWEDLFISSSSKESEQTKFTLQYDCRYEYVAKINVYLFISN